MNQPPIHLGLPKGHMAGGVQQLLGDAGITVTPTARGYRPVISLPGFEVKILKPQNIVEMLDLGTRDVGFAGADWVAELRADLIEVLDTGMDTVQLVAAADESWEQFPERRLVVATEYLNLTETWVKEQDLDAEIIRSYGATEVFPPEDADVIVDNSATGATLRANGLKVFEVLGESSTRLYASQRAMADPITRERITDLALLLESVLNARRRVMLEVNAAPDRLDALVALLPSMREATVAPLYGNQGFAVRAAVPRDELPGLIPAIKAAGGTDLVVTNLSQIVP
ncbi:MAG: ATP phosphoribosyltransferase [Acidimicrobiia bacterium]|nr:ATP phosphoribosyltransferase [Acidimicrobiia bacterium]RZV45122.1 MAG: ATP phosphoribosyltransferase [Acidimicrobiia bacterium]